MFTFLSAGMYVYLWGYIDKRQWLLQTMVYEFSPHFMFYHIWRLKGNKGDNFYLRQNIRTALTNSLYTPHSVLPQFSIHHIYKNKIISLTSTGIATQCHGFHGFSRPVMRSADRSPGVTSHGEEPSSVGSRGCRHPRPSYSTRLTGILTLKQSLLA